MDEGLNTPFCGLRERAEAGVFWLCGYATKQNTELPLHASEQDTNPIPSE